jgi:2-polyprenyl-6-methoxyphenol hydroxylase-like FAD-dependent oxidoreductase
MTENQRRQGVSPHVLIIGGGIGGLCLAQGLMNEGISVAVYERASSPAEGGQGYRLSLKKIGTDALRACLSPTLFELCAATAIRPATRMVFTDHELNPKFAKPIPPADGDNETFGVNRLTLREILLSGLDNAVHHGRTLARFEQPVAGGVVAHFTDGTAASGDLLVGADGAESVTRKQLLPHARLASLNWSIWGRTPLTPGLLHAIPDVLVDTFNRVIGPEDIAFSAVTCRTREPVEQAAVRIAPTARLTDVPDYLSWTLTLPDEPRDADPSALLLGVQDRIRSWHPAVRHIVDNADVPATFPVEIRSALPVDPWPTTTTTLLGDAIHTMSPGRGDGANTALRDAHLLRDTLVAVRHGAALLDAVARYESEMLRYGFDAVARSRAAPFAPPRPRVTHGGGLPFA